MDTKSKNWASSKITKVILFTIFLTTVWCVLFYGACFIDVSISNDIPFDSVQSPNPEDGSTFHWFEEELFVALHHKGEVTELPYYEQMPTVYYRAEYPDGSTISNVDASLKDDFFRSHKVFTILTSRPDGRWEQVSDKDRSDRRTYDTPQPIYHDNYVTSVTAYTNGFGFTTTESNEVVAMAPTEDDTNQFGWSAANPCPVVRVAFAYDDAALATMADYYRQCRSYILTQITVICLLSLVALVCAIWLLITCGRRRGSSELHTVAIDRIPAELQLCIGFGMGVIFVLLCTWGGYQLQYVRVFSDPVFFMSLVSGITTVAVLALVWCMSIVRMIKARSFLRSSITFHLIRWCWRPFAKLWNMLRGCFDERAFASSGLTVSLHRRKLLLIAISGGMALLLLLFSLMEGSFLAALVLLGIIVFAALCYWSIKGDQRTYELISQNMSDSFAEQMKSERTKTALITNVSHDLKTPLTSIITYVELLSQEELGDTARDYVTVLAQKSERLKSMVSDLFDLAKSSSGNLPLDLETLDLHRLLEQTLADMRDSIDASGLTLKTNFPESEVFIRSDGKKLYRVFQNIIGNTLKYSLNGTRVFVSLELVEGRAVATVRNTAGYEMDFTADEVLQRFVRGDKSRSGEGSGLGLSIAESFTTACGGDFRLAIDGDLFKVTTSFPVLAAAQSDEAKNA